MPGPALQRVVEVRPEIDAALRLPLAQRQPGLAQAWNDAATALVDRLEHVSLALTNKIRMADPVIADLMAIKDASHTVRDAAGLGRDPIQRAMATKTLTPDLKADAAELRGKVEAGWRLLRNLTTRKGVPEPILAAVNAADHAFFGSYLKQQDAVEKALAAGAASPLSDAELVAASNAALDVLVAIPNTALDLAVGHAARQSGEAWMNLLLQGGLLLVSLGLSAIGFLVAWRRIARPIEHISGAMRQVAAGDLATEVPFLGRRDEIGMLSDALMVFKDAALPSDGAAHDGGQRLPGRRQDRLIPMARTRRISRGRCRRRRDRSGSRSG
jgi:HAMP domain-containing protein